MRAGVQGFLHGQRSAAVPSRRARPLGDFTALQSLSTPSSMDRSIGYRLRMTAKFRNAEKHGKTIRDLALGYPEATEAHPWGEVAIKVKNKTFLFLGYSDTHLSFSVKLPSSGREALDLPYCEPTHYGLGSKGWVTAKFLIGKSPPMKLVRGWIHESYVTIAPKSLARLVPKPL